MAKANHGTEPRTGDIRAERSARDEAAARLLLVAALREQPGFWEQVEQVARNPDEAEALARRYVRRDAWPQVDGEAEALARNVLRDAWPPDEAEDEDAPALGPKRERIAVLLWRAGAAYASGGRPHAEEALANSCTFAYFPGGVVSKGQPQRASRQAETLDAGARRVARRGAGGVCVGCGDERGASSRGKECERCRTARRPPREGVEAEKALWLALDVRARAPVARAAHPCHGRRARSPRPCRRRYPRAWTGRGCSSRSSSRRCIAGSWRSSLSGAGYSSS